MCACPRFSSVLLIPFESIKFHVLKTLADCLVVKTLMIDFAYFPRKKNNKKKGDNHFGISVVSPCDLIAGRITMSLGCPRVAHQNLVCSSRSARLLVRLRRLASLRIPFVEWLKIDKGYKVEREREGVLEPNHWSSSKNHFRLVLVCLNPPICHRACNRIFAPPPPSLSYLPSSKLLSCFFLLPPPSPPSLPSSKPLWCLCSADSFISPVQLLQTPVASNFVMALNCVWSIAS